MAAVTAAWKAALSTLTDILVVVAQFADLPRQAQCELLIGTHHSAQVGVVALRRLGPHPFVARSSLAALLALGLPALISFLAVSAGKCALPQRGGHTGARSRCACAC